MFKKKISVFILPFIAIGILQAKKAEQPPMQTQQHYFGMMQRSQTLPGNIVSHYMNLIQYFLDVQFCIFQIFSLSGSYYVIINQQE